MKIQYIRDNNNKPFGVLVAVKDEGSATVRVGYSLVAHGDRFDKKLGRRIAEGRAMNARHNKVSVAVRDQFTDFVDHLADRKEYAGYRIPHPDAFVFVDNKGRVIK